MKNRVCEALGIKYPIIQGAMAWTSYPSLVTAVSEAGGLGVLGSGFVPPEILREQIREVKKGTDKPFAANIFMMPDLLKSNGPVLVEEKVPVIYVDILANLDMGLARKYFDIWHNNGSKIVFKASFISDAVKAQEAGADVIIVKGWEGGGHVTEETTMVLVPQAADVIHKPLVASGGICDGRGMAAGIVLGADGIEMGSAFMLAKECDIKDNAKEEIIKCQDMETDIVGMCTGEPCRQIRNDLSRRLNEIEAGHVRKEAIGIFRKESEGSLRKGVREGDIHNGAVMIGQIVPLLREIRTAEEIIESTIRECTEILSKEMLLGL